MVHVQQSRVPHFQRFHSRSLLRGDIDVIPFPPRDCSCSPIMIDDFSLSAPVSPSTALHNKERAAGARWLTRGTVITRATAQRTLGEARQIALLHLVPPHHGMKLTRVPPLPPLYSPSGNVFNRRSAPITLLQLLLYRSEGGDRDLSERKFPLVFQLVNATHHLFYLAPPCVFSLRLLFTHYPSGELGYTYQGVHCPRGLFRGSPVLPEARLSYCQIRARIRRFALRLVFNRYRFSFFGCSWGLFVSLLFLSDRMTKRVGVGLKCLKMFICTIWIIIQ